MEMRQRRGKQMPMAPPPTVVHNDESESESSEASEEVSESALSTHDDDRVLVEGIPDADANQLNVLATHVTGSADNDDNDDEDFDDDDDVEIEMENYFIPPPELPPLSITDNEDVGKIYSELISTCKTLASNPDKAANKEFHAVMSRNILQGHEVFKYMMKGSIGGPDAQGYGQRRRAGGPSDMYLALQHTKAASGIIRSKAERIGTGPSIFSVDSFLESLKKEFVGEDRQYSPKLAAGNIAMQLSLGSTTLMPLVALVGTYDSTVVSVPKPKKIPQKRSTLPVEVDEQQEGPTVDDGNMQVAEKNPAADDLAKGINKILKTVCRQSSEPVNLFEFVIDRGSFPRTIENLFYFGFLVQDGHVSLTKEENGKLKDLSLSIKPEKSQKLDTKSPDDGEGTRNQTNRQTYILSFSPRQWKSICAMSQGDDIISHYQTLMGKQPLAAIQHN